MIETYAAFALVRLRGVFLGRGSAASKLSRGSGSSIAGRPRAGSASTHRLISRSAGDPAVAIEERIAPSCEASPRPRGPSLLRVDRPCPFTFRMDVIVTSGVRTQKSGAHDTRASGLWTRVDRKIACRPAPGLSSRKAISGA
jgi:hypothetical protein